MSVLLLLATALVCVATGHSLRRSAQQRRRRAEDLQNAVEALRGLASELAAGAPPLDALRAVAGDLAAAADSDRAVPRTLLRAGGAPDAAAAARALRRSGLPGLSAFGSAWHVSAETGAALAESLARLAAATARAATDAREVQAVLAGPRTTARLLAVLPLIGMLLAASTGADPLGFLFGSSPGGFCLLAGVVLDATGLWWIERLAADP